MCLIEVDVQCTDQNSEILPDEKENAEFLLEDLVGQILLDLFAAVIVDEVTLNFSFDTTTERQSWYSIHIQVHSLMSPSTVSKHKIENMELVLEGKIGSALMELFGMVHVEQVTITLLPSTMVTS